MILTQNHYFKENSSQIFHLILSLISALHLSRASVYKGFLVFISYMSLIFKRNRSRVLLLLGLRDGSGRLTLLHIF